MSAITIPEGFFPPPGVPLQSIRQLEVACALANSSMIDLQVKGTDGAFYKWQGIGNSNPECYRIAPPKPRTVGPFESNDVLLANSTNFYHDAFSQARDAATHSGFKKFKITCTATAEEIL